MFKNELKNTSNEINKSNKKYKSNQLKNINNFYSNLHSNSCSCDKCQKNKILFSNKLFKFN